MRWQADIIKTLHWRHNDHDGVSNHQPHGCLLNRLFRGRSKKTSKLRVTGLCAGNSPEPVNSPHKGPVTRKMFPFDDVSWIRLLLPCVFVSVGGGGLFLPGLSQLHYNDVIMSAMASQITGISIVCSTVGSDADQRKHLSSAALTFVRKIHLWPVTFPQKRTVTRKMFPFDDVIMFSAFFAFSCCWRAFTLGVSTH